MKIIFFQHVEFEKPRLLESWALERSHSFDTIHLYKGEKVSSDIEYDMLCILGGPMSVHDEIEWYAYEKNFIANAIKQNKIVIGICLGAQLIAEQLGAKVYKNEKKEIGWFPINCDIAFLENKMMVYHWHGETFDLPDNSRPLASSEACNNQAFVYNEKVLAMQFHLEMDEAAIREIHNACGDELVEDTFIQSKESQLKQLCYLENCKEQLFDLLDGIEYSLEN